MAINLFRKTPEQASGNTQPTCTVTRGMQLLAPEHQGRAWHVDEAGNRLEGEAGGVEAAGGAGIVSLGSGPTQERTEPESLRH